MNRKGSAALSLAMALTASGHAASTTRYAHQPTAESKGTRFRGLFLAESTSSGYESRGPLEGGQVIVEHARCDPWARAAIDVCTPETLLTGMQP